MGHTGLGDIAADEFTAVIVAGRGGFAEGAPLRDLPIGALDLRISLNPFEDLTISFATSALIATGSMPTNVRKRWSMGQA